MKYFKNNWKLIQQQYFNPLHIDTEKHVTIPYDLNFSAKITTKVQKYSIQQQLNDYNVDKVKCVRNFPQNKTHTKKTKQEHNTTIELKGI